METSKKMAGHIINTRKAVSPLPPLLEQSRAQQLQNMFCPMMRLVGLNQRLRFEAKTNLTYNMTDRKTETRYGDRLLTSFQTNTAKDLQHILFYVTLHEKLYLAPISPDIRNVLDIGTGKVDRNYC
jgi:hypothetical protein